MESAFQDDDFFLVNKWILLFREPRRGDVIQAYHVREDKVLLKRVIGLPGERLSIHDGFVFLIDSSNQEQPLIENYLDKNVRTQTPENVTTSYTRIPPNHYFLMGDNRPMSGDSRGYGPVHRSLIYGLVTKPSVFSQKK